MRLPLERPLILGHRGDPRRAPENTLRSFQLALEAGADGVELDVQPSADGVAVVIHDETLARTTDAAGAVATLPWTEIARARLAGGERVPRLEEVASWASEAGAWLNVEFKATGTEATSLRILDEAEMLPRTIFSSFLPEVVARIGRLASGAHRLLLLEQWDPAARHALHRSGASGVCLHHRAATPEVLGELAAAELPVVVWTVDDPVRMRALLGAGVAAIITNVPATGATIRHELGL